MFSMKFPRIVLFLIFSSINSIESSAIEITNENLREILSSNEFILINFYVRRCRFSEQLNPIIDQLADEIQRIYFNHRNVTVGKVNCDDQRSLLFLHYRFAFGLFDDENEFHFSFDWRKISN